MSRLEEIKEYYEAEHYDFNLNKYDIDWLIEQAEQRESYKDDVVEQNYEIVRLLNQNKRYREVIQEAINKCRWNNAETANILLEALERESE